MSSTGANRLVRMLRQVLGVVAYERLRAESAAVPLTRAESLIQQAAPEAPQSAE